MYTIGERVFHRVFDLNGHVTKVDNKTVSILFNNGYFRVFELDTSNMYLKRLSLKQE